MYVRDIMTADVIVIPSDMPILEAERIMETNKFERLPVVDNEKLVGLVTKDNLLKAGPSSANSLSRGELIYILSNLKVQDVMKKKVVTVTPDTTVESAIATAQNNHVGCLPVLKGDLVVGIVTTNDFVYKILNPLLGINEKGRRITVHGAGKAREAEKVLACVNTLNMSIKTLWRPTDEADKKDLVVHVEEEDVSQLVAKLKDMGFSVEERPFS
jgi:acetoin utilization protein AcuB